MLMSHPAIPEAGTVKPNGRQPRATSEGFTSNGHIAVGSPYPTDDLGPAAKRMAKKSVNRLSEPQIARELRSLNRLLRTERQCKLKLGDSLVVLIDHHKLRPVDIARYVKERANHLSEAYHVATMFPPATRQPHVPYTAFWMAMRTVRKFKELKLDPMETLAEIAAHGFTQHRDVTRHFAAKLRERQNRKALAESAKTAVGQPFNRCYHARFQDLLNVFPDHSAKILHIDPPYANYKRLGDGRYCGGSLTRTDCDSATAAEAIALTTDLLEHWGPKLKPGGVLLLWQASGPLRQRIAEAMEKFGWETEIVAIWDKGHIQAGNFEAPYSVQTEWLWVLRRAGDRLINHDNSPRGDVLRFAPVHQSAETADHRHAFEKPVELCKFLVGKHSFEGELVVDLCACTGAMSVAAAQMNRRWAYIESNPTNYRVGSERIARTLDRPSKAAG